MVKLFTLWPGYVNYGLLKITSFKIKTEFLYVMYNFLNKLIFKKIKSFTALKTLGKSKNFNKTYFYLLVAKGSSFLIHLPIPVTYPSLCSTCVTYRTPCYAIGHQVLPTQPLPREAEDFPRGHKHFKHVPLLTYLIYFSPKGVNLVGPIYMPKPPHGTLISLSLVLNQHFKSPIC